MSRTKPNRSPRELDRVKVPEQPAEQGLPTGDTNGIPSVGRALVGHIRRSDGLPISTSRVGQPLSRRKAGILAFVRDFTARNQFPPTIREIARSCSLSSTSHAAYHLQGLEKMGYITRIPQTARCIVLTELGRSGAAV